ncbi:hypothetical protein HPP92_026797 [Vanilla planifolia]|uniref:PUB 62/63 C-terminal domain-containing protein n=1 Tax=Vanilla planifolia TaxID=51239 RepID=A0A835U5U3_VANPL|nr:hypothetical protein HPP92_026797 [Vanilla planifolia]
MSRESVDRRLGILSGRTGCSEPAMAPSELCLVQPQRMENGSNSRMVFLEDSMSFSLAGGCVDHSAAAFRKSRPACGFFAEGTKLFSSDKGEGRLFSCPEAAHRRSFYGSLSRMEREGENTMNRSWNVDGNGNGGSASGDDGSDGDDEEEDVEDGVEDEELNGDGEVDGLVTVDEGNTKNSNNSSGSVQSSSEKVHSDKLSMQEHHACFGLGRMLMAKDGNDPRGNSAERLHHSEGRSNYQNAITVVEPELYCNQILLVGDGSSAPQKSFRGDCGSGFSCRREVSLTAYPGESLRAHLSDPVSGILMDDAMILPCGHSFGSSGMQHICRTKACFSCSLPVSEDSIRPNLALRAAVQAFLREEELHCLKISKRRRDRFEQDKYGHDDQFSLDSRSKGVRFPFNVSDRVIIKGNKRTPERFVGRMAVVTTQCLNGWYVVKTLDTAESIKLQYRSLSKVTDDSSNLIGNKSTSPSWL